MSNSAKSKRWWSNLRGGKWRRVNGQTTQKLSTCTQRNSFPKYSYKIMWFRRNCRFCYRKHSTLVFHFLCLRCTRLSGPTRWSLRSYQSLSAALVLELHMDGKLFSRCWQSTSFVALMISFSEPTLQQETCYLTAGGIYDNMRVKHEK